MFFQLIQYFNLFFLLTFVIGQLNSQYRVIRRKSFPDTSAEKCKWLLYLIFGIMQYPVFHLSKDAFPFRVSH